MVYFNLIEPDEMNYSPDIAAARVAREERVSYQ